MQSKQQASAEEAQSRAAFLETFKACPLPERELLANLGLFIKRQDLSRILLMNDLYQKILEVHGDIIEFGVRWGQNMALFESLKGLYEPFNYNRRILGFDTFEGFPSIHEKDGAAEILHQGGYGVTENYADYLASVLDYHEGESPLSHIKSYRLIKGDASVEFERYMQEHPETLVAMAYFDFDLYAPTKACLAHLLPHLVKGSLLVFDELSHPLYPGETVAVKEVLDLNMGSLRRSPYSATQAYMIVEELPRTSRG